MRLTGPLLAGVLAAGSFLAAPAQAACFGTQQLAYACVTPPTLERRQVQQCVYTGGDTCENVTVPYYGLGDDAEVSCGGTLDTCTQVNRIVDLFRACGPIVACP
ncbi:MAG TPA: hypothetical protein VGX28_03680 [Frankiaceae bacterium]|jgi:hypothetical protein|nr:hypothetical protein [Frankiaceae bacterium]